jgi:hypothetical protein
MPCPLHPKQKKGKCISCKGWKCCPQSSECDDTACHSLGATFGPRPCSIHPNQKKGQCMSCKGHKCCPPSTGCDNANSHYSAKASCCKKRKSTMHRQDSDEFDEDNKVSDEDDKVSWQGFLAPVLKSVPPKKRYNECISKEIYSQRKTAIAITMMALGIIADPLEVATWIPDGGFSVDGIMDMTSRQHRRAKSMHQAITSKLAKLLCPTDPSLCQSFLAGWSRELLYFWIRTKRADKERDWPVPFWRQRRISCGQFFNFVLLYDERGE